MSFFKDRTGEVWLGVHAFDEGDVQLVTRSEERSGACRHRVLDLETGELSWTVERDPGVWEPWAEQAGRRRLA